MTFHVKQIVHMKCHNSFSLKTKKKKKIDMLPAAVVIGTLRVKISIKVSLVHNMYMYLNLKSMQ